MTFPTVYEAILGLKDGVAAFGAIGRPTVPTMDCVIEGLRCRKKLVVPEGVPLSEVKLRPGGLPASLPNPFRGAIELGK